MAPHQPVFEPLAVDEDGKPLLEPYTVSGGVNDQHLNPGAPLPPRTDYLRLDHITAQQEHGTATRTTYAPLQYNSHTPNFAQHHHIARAVTPPRTRTPPPMPIMIHQYTAILHQPSPMDFQEHALPATQYNLHDQYQTYIWASGDATGGAHVGDDTRVGIHPWLQDSSDFTVYHNYGGSHPDTYACAPAAPVPGPVVPPQPSNAPSAATTRTNGPHVCYRAGCNHKTFSIQSALRKHLKNHMPEYYRDYGCSKPGCTHRSWWPKDMLRHDCNMHHGVETRCPYCNTSFLDQMRNETRAKKRVMDHIAAQHKDSRGFEAMSIQTILDIIARADESNTEASSVRSPSTVFSPGMDSVPDTPFTGPNTLFAPLTPHPSNPILATPSRGYHAGAPNGTYPAPDMDLDQEYKSE